MLCSMEYKDKSPFNTSCPDIERVFIIGRLELARRERGMTEQDMYDFEMSLKDPEFRKKLAEESEEGYTEAHFEQVHSELNFRRRLFKWLRKDGKECQRKMQEAIEKSGENTQNIEVSQNFKENTNGQKAD